MLPAGDLNALHPDIWPRNASRGPDGQIVLAGADVRDLAATDATPVMVVDEADFRCAPGFRRFHRIKGR